MKRGDVWWAELDGDAGFRPVAIVSRTDALERRRNLTIAEVTRVVRGIPSEVPLSKSDGMPADCVINADNLHMIPNNHLRIQTTALDDEHAFELDQALRYALELDW